jgi:hypothetical protein
MKRGLPERRASHLKDEGVPLRYDPRYRGMVFPLGMYTAHTFQLSKAINFAPLLIVPRCFISLALAAFAGLIHAIFFGRARA